MERKKTITIMLALSMVLIFALAAEAGPLRPGPQSRGGGMQVEALKSFIELKLTPEQQTKLTDLIAKYQEQQRNLNDRMRGEGRGLIRELRSEEFNEENARDAYRTASSFREDSFILRLKMLHDIKSVLTPAQQELLQARKAQRRDKMMERLESMLEMRDE